MGLLRPDRSPLLALGSVVVVIVAGVDHLYRWTSAFPVWVHITAPVAITLGYTYSSWALVVNRFFSGTVHIQTERGRHVVTDGPYRFVRHPAYAGAVFALLPPQVKVAGQIANLPSAI